MCGLAGTARFGGAPLDPRTDALLADLSRAVAHRGPDGERLFRDGPVGLAFRRLALVDPLGGDQPLTDTDGSVVLIANGEVYNHRELQAGLGSGVRFRTRSDCEVLAHLYARDGLSFLDGVRGMFAIILWDRRRNRLVLARDRFGIKPLYLAQHADGVTFASEIKALFADPRCPRGLDWEGALGDQCLTAAPQLARQPVASWFHGVDVIPAGTIVTIDLLTGRRSEHRYWQLPPFDGGGTIGDGEFVQRYRDLLAASVADCAAADAEVGLFLSGGVDSAAVAALAARTRAVPTFTVLTGSTLANGDAEHAHLVAATLGLPNHQLLFPADRVPHREEWKRLLWLLETPLCGPEQYYKFELHRYVKQLRPELRGMLLGQASDEFNGGYSAPLSGGAGWAGFESTVAGLARQGRLNQRPDLAPWWQHHDPPLLTDAFLAACTSGDDTPAYPAYVHWKYRDIQQYNCWHEDRTAAGNGIEARVPFLDHRLVELLATIPPARRARLLWDKRILRQAVRDLLPAAVEQREKVPFYRGVGAELTHRTFVRMLAQDGGALVDEALAAPGAVGVLDPGAVRGLLARLQTQPEPAGVEFLLRLVNLGLLDAMTRSLPLPPVDAPRRPPPPAAEITDWDRDRDRLEVLLRPAHHVSPDAVLEFADGVLLVHAPVDPDTWYLVVDGQFEYTVDATGDAAWCAFLRAVDGRRTLAEILAGGVPWDGVAALLGTAIDDRLLVVRPPAGSALVHPTPAAALAVHPARPGAFR